jgi:hypothetical protein
MPTYELVAEYYITNHLGEVKADSYEEARKIAETRSEELHDKIFEELEFDIPEIKVLEIKNV